MLQGHFAKETIFASKEAQKNKSGPNCFVACLLIVPIEKIRDCRSITEVGRGRRLFDDMVDESKIW